MGCNIISTADPWFSPPKTIKLSLPTINSSILSNANIIIASITKLHNRLLFIYHKLLYASAACVFLAPRISTCFHTIFYKISSDWKGTVEKINLNYIDEAPYIQIDSTHLSGETRTIFKVFLNFIVELRSYKAIIKQIDRHVPELLYLLFENKHEIMNENVTKINWAHSMFEETRKIRNEMWREYKEEIYTYWTKNELYCKEINTIGKDAYENNITDIYEIAFLYKKHFPTARNPDQKEGNKQHVKTGNIMHATISTAKREIWSIIARDEQCVWWDKDADINTNSYHVNYMNTNSLNSD